MNTSDTLFRVSADGILHTGEGAFRCALGRNGVCPADEKREGDLKTPAGVWPFRRLYYRPDRVSPPQSTLPVSPLSPNDGWCDAPDDPLYNRPVSLPYPASHERLWRDDHVYDLILEIGHNDDPPVPGLGSAVFVHLKRNDYEPTEGCIALDEADFRTLVAMIRDGDALQIDI